MLGSVIIGFLILLFTYTPANMRVTLAVVLIASLIASLIVLYIIFIVLLPLLPPRADDTTEMGTHSRHWERHEEFVEVCKKRKKQLEDEEEYLLKTNQSITDQLIIEALHAGLKSVSQVVEFYSDDNAPRRERAISLTSIENLSKFIKASGVIVDYAKIEEVAQEYSNEKAIEAFLYMKDLYEEEAYQCRKYHQYYMYHFINKKRIRVTELIINRLKELASS